MTEPPHITLTPLTTLPRQVILGILPFEIVDRNGQLRWLSRGMAELLTADLSAVGTLRIFDQARLPAIQMELTRQYHGSTADDALVQLGNQLGMTVMLTGTLTRLTPTQLRLDVRLTNIESAELLTTLSRTTTLADLLTTEHELARTLLELLHALPTPSQLAQWTRPQPEFLSALEAYTEGLTALHRHDVAQAQHAFEQTLRLAPSFQPAQNSLADPRLSPIMPQQWTPAPTDRPDSLPTDPYSAIDQLLHELVQEGLYIELGVLAPTALPRLPVHLTLTPAWIDRFAEARPRLQLGPFQTEIGTSTTPVHVIHEGQTLSYFLTELRALTLLLTFRSPRNEIVTEIPVCLAHDTYLNSPIRATLAPTRQFLLQSGHPILVTLPLRNELWTMVHHIDFTITLNHALCGTFATAS